MRRWLPAVLLALTLLLAGCPAPGYQDEPVPAAEPQQEQLVLTIATAANWDNTMYGAGLQTLAERLEELSGGALSVKLYDKSRAGGDAELLVGIEKGTLCIVNAVTAAQLDLVPQVAMFGSPAVLDSCETFNEMMQGDYAEVVQGFYNEAGLQLLACFAVDFRLLLTREPVRSAQDLAGLRLRTLHNRYDEAYWRALGASTYPMSFNELYAALQSDRIDALENPISVVVPNRLTDLLGHVILTEHSVSVATYVMNLEYYQSLSDEQRGWLERAMEEMVEQLLAEAPAEEARMMQVLEVSGVEFIRPNETFRAELQQGAGLVLDLLREDLGNAVVEEFLQAMREAEERLAAREDAQ